MDDGGWVDRQGGRARCEDEARSRMAGGGKWARGADAHKAGAGQLDLPALAAGGGCERAGGAT